MNVDLCGDIEIRRIYLEALSGTVLGIVGCLVVYGGLM